MILWIPDILKLLRTEDFQPLRSRKLHSMNKCLKPFQKLCCGCIKEPCSSEFQRSAQRSSFLLLHSQNLWYLVSKDLLLFRSQSIWFDFERSTEYFLVSNPCGRFDIHCEEQKSPWRYGRHNICKEAMKQYRNSSIFPKAILFRDSPSENKEWSHLEKFCGVWQRNRNLNK